MKKLLFGILLAIVGGFLIIAPNDDIGFYLGRILMLASIFMGITGYNSKEK